MKNEFKNIIIKDNFYQSSCFNMAKDGYKVHVISDCVTSYDLRKIDEMLLYYAKQGCEVKTLAEIMNS